MIFSYFDMKKEPFLVLDLDFNDPTLYALYDLVYPIFDLFK